MVIDLFRIIKVRIPKNLIRKKYQIHRDIWYLNSKNEQKSSHILFVLNFVAT